MDETVTANIDGEIFVNVVGWLLIDAQGLSAMSVHPGVDRASLAAVFRVLAERCDAGTL